MTARRKTKRAREIQESLLEANVGCLLILVLLMGLPFIALGGFFIYMGHKEMRAQSSLNYRAIQAPAKILSSEVRQQTIRTGPGTGSSTSDYWPEITFSCEHEGVSLTSTKVWVVGKGGSEAEAKAVQRRYPEGAVVSSAISTTTVGIHSGRSKKSTTLGI